MCVQEFEVFANNKEEALEIARKKYDLGKFVLESGQCQYRQMAVISLNSNDNEWLEF